MKKDRYYIDHSSLDNSAEGTEARRRSPLVVTPSVKEDSQRTIIGQLPSLRAISSRVVSATEIREGPVFKD